MTSVLTWDCVTELNEELGCHVTVGQDEHMYEHTSPAVHMCVKESVTLRYVNSRSAFLIAEVTLSFGIQSMINNVISISITLRV